MDADDFRFSHHRAIYAWLFILAAFGALMLTAWAKHAGYNGPGSLNRLGTESESTGGAAQGAGFGDVGNVGGRRH